MHKYNFIFGRTFSQQTLNSAQILRLYLCFSSKTLKSVNNSLDLTRKPTYKCNFYLKEKIINSTRILRLYLYFSFKKLRPVNNSLLSACKPRPKVGCLKM